MDTVDGRNPAPVEVVVYPTFYKVSYIPGGAGFFLQYDSKERFCNLGLSKTTKVLKEASWLKEDLDTLRKEHTTGVSGIYPIYGVVA